ncbi:hypothetical protein C8Q80DRAFT_1266425 [Daedaleopsis nitida]|nr:hypothetical protein C8Q80DRAFT_1266425 [Daedaleopsis nitida]
MSRPSRQYISNGKTKPKPIVFYDIPCRADVAPGLKPWSPNTWKARYALNIKGIPYETFWVELPDIAPLCEKLGAAPGGVRPDTGAPLHTLPLINDPNTGATVADSAAIVRYLDKTYPYPSASRAPALIPAETDALHGAFKQAIMAVVFPNIPGVLLPALHARLNAASQGYFLQTRAEWFGKMEEFREPARHARHWEGMQRGFHTIAGWLEGNSEKREEEERLLFGHTTISFADVTIAATLQCFRVVFGEESEEWRDVLSWDGGRWARFMEVFRRYDNVDMGRSWKA